MRACAEEDKDGWRCLLQDLRSRGVSEIDLMVTDGHDGLLAAVGALFRHLLFHNTRDGVFFLHMLDRCLHILKHRGPRPLLRRANRHNMLIRTIPLINLYVQALYVQEKL